MIAAADINSNPGELALSRSEFSEPGFPTSVPVIMILVPGYAFLRALYIADAQGLVEGLSTGFQVVLIIGAIIAGVFVGDTIGSFDVLKRIKG